MSEVEDLLKTENSDADIEAILDSEFEEEGEPAKERPAETEAQDIVEEEIDEDEIAEILGGDTGEEPPKKEHPQPQQPKKESVKKKQVPKQPQRQQKEKYHEPDKILIYSEPKVGKTHAIASLMEKALNENPDTRFFVIVTDAGFWKTVLRYWRIRKLDEEKLYNQVSYYSVVDINEVLLNPD